MAMGQCGENHHVLYVNSRPETKNMSAKTVSRLGMVSGFLVLVVLAGFASVNVTNNSSDVKMISKLKPGTTLAAELLKAAVHSDTKAMLREAHAWRDHQIANLDEFSSVQMLRQVKSVNTMLADDSSICAAKATVISKLNELVSKIEGEIDNLNATDAAKLHAKNSAHQAYLDTEAQYRLMLQKEEQATEGSKFASDKYEKWAEAVGDAETRYSSVLAEYNAALVTATQEKTLLQSIITMLSQIKGFNASNGATLSQISAKINLLKQVAGKSNQKQLADLTKKFSLARVQKLADAGEVVGLLKGMIDQLDQHLSTMSAAVTAASEDVDAHKVKLARYQQDVVDLSNAADQAHHDSVSAKLHRQGLLGDDVSSSEDYEAEHADFLVTYPPAAQELAIIKTVIAKVKSICA